MTGKTNSPRPIERAKSAPVAASILDYLLSVFGGAVVTMLVLWLFKFGASEVWSPFARVGARFVGALALSALAGGMASAILNRRLDGPLAATSCAAGWVLWGLSLHWGARGRYLALSGDGFPDGALISILFSNAISQSLCVALALLIALVASWFWTRRRADDVVQTPISDDDLEGNGLKSFGTAFFFPLATLIGGVIALSIFGALALPLGEPRLEQLPSGPAVAAVCGVLTMCALFVATFVTRRALRALGSVGDVIVAPLVIAFVAMMFLASGGQMSLLRPAALLIWHTSAFELASWSALGASLGFSFARSKMKI